ncbi:hypothetical protein B0A55_09533 [Friedmanniomyces simplex]|uniref:Uncharacterized protein n=1 Tax=Friedmanniomyces simplex TaxID=329884 RepID=A0A4U0XBE9_9PEZI|nr:hypothetical protein B0A55_09533 [Friedmanniomyces simplex]
MLVGCIRGMAGSRSYSVLYSRASNARGKTSAQLKALRGWYESLIFQRLRSAIDFLYMRAGVVYCTRVLAIKVILPSEQREVQNGADDKRFRQMRDEYLADGTYNVGSMILSLLAYGKSIALSHNNAGSVSWRKDRLVMSYRSRPISLARIRTMIGDVITEAADKLWTKLMWRKRDYRFEVPLEQFEDDVTFMKRAVSFLTNRASGLVDKRGWMPKLFLQDRNVFVIQGQMVVVTRYHKSQSQFYKPKVILRFLLWKVGQLLAMYLAYVQPLQWYLSEEVRGFGYSDHFWANEYGPWGTDRLTKIIRRETEERLGTRLTTLDYLHVAISIEREVVGDHFTQGYIKETSEIEEVRSTRMTPWRSWQDEVEIGANR